VSKLLSALVPRAAQVRKQFSAPRRHRDGGLELLLKRLKGYKKSILSITWGLKGQKPGFSEKPGFFPRTIEMIPKKTRGELIQLSPCDRAIPIHLSS
jgi:hypothetical protein